MRIPAGKWGIVVLTTLAAALRWASVWDAPLTHDELITLERLRFASFAEVIQGGVMTDTHPAGVHVLLWLWTHVVGWSDLWIRMPFVLMGVACIPLTYRALRLWTNETTAVMAAAFMAAAQFPIYYSALARPYIPGLLWMLLAIPPFVAIVWKGSRRKSDLVWLALSWAGMAYTQHLAMLHAATMAIAGLIWVSASQRKVYMWACGLALLLYLPHVPITWHQLQRGGVGGAEGWLAAPTWDWPNHFLAYLTHFIPGALMLVMVLLALQKPWSQPMWLKAAILAMLPLAIAMAYSMWVNPLLQYSGLLFGLPFWLVVLFYRKESQGWKNLWEPAILALILTVTLVRERRHFDWMSETGYRHFAQALQAHPERFGLHRDAYRCIAHYQSNGTWLAGMPNDAVSQDSLRKWLETNPKSELQVGNAQPHHLAVIREYYSAESVVFQGFTSETRVFEHTGSPTQRTVFYATGQTPLRPDETFAAVQRFSFDALVQRPWDRIGLAAQGWAPGVVGYLVIKHGEEALVWKHVNFQVTSSFHYNVSDLLTDLRDVPPSGTVVEVGIINETGAPASIDSLYAWIEEGNRWQYALIAPIPQPYAR